MDKKKPNNSAVLGYFNNGMFMVKKPRKVVFLLIIFLVFLLYIEAMLRFKEIFREHKVYKSMRTASKKEYELKKYRRLTYFGYTDSKGCMNLLPSVVGVTRSFDRRLPSAV